MTDWTIPSIIGPAILLGGYACAAVADVRTREVTDRLWHLMGVPD